MHRVWTSYTCIKSYLSHGMVWRAIYIRGACGLALMISGNIVPKLAEYNGSHIKDIILFIFNQKMQLLFSVIKTCYIIMKMLSLSFCD